MKFRISATGIALAALLVSQPAFAAPPAAPAATGSATLKLSFVPHAAFFSLHTKQPELVDPEVFVTAAGAPPATAYQQIAHAAGIRNALMSDDGTELARDANGRSLGVDLQHWFSATGVLAIAPSDTAGASVTAHFTGLVPNGRYSLFQIHLSNDAASVTPLDGTGTTSSFSAHADGSAEISLTTPRALRAGEGIVLMFHSDGKDHGLQTGSPGIDTEAQMVVKIP